MARFAKCLVLLSVLLLTFDSTASNNLAGASQPGKEVVLKSADITAKFSRNEFSPQPDAPVQSAIPAGDLPMISVLAGMVDNSGY